MNMNYIFWLDMGVDFNGFSNVRTEPIPIRFRATRKPVSNEKRENILKEIVNASPDMRGLIMVFLGVQVTANGVIIPDKIEISSELQNEFYDTIGQEEDFLAVCWNTNTIYRSTPDTKSGSTGRSYSGYSEFYNNLNALNKSPLPYLPPSTDVAPECGFVNTEKCILCLQGLNTVRDHFVSPEWKGDSPFDDSLLKKDDDSEFFCEFYSLMALGAESGFVRIT